MLSRKKCLTLVRLELEKDAGLSTGLNVGVPVAILIMSIVAVNTNTRTIRAANLFICIIINHTSIRSN